jgi:MinD-like ATPase involved in chromosome partitioning or flagellar assembly
MRGSFPLYWQDLEPYLTPVPGRNIHLLSAKQVKGAYHLPLNRIIQLISSLKTYFDLILIDTDMASTDASAKLMEMSDLALLITDDTECSIKNNQRFRRLLTQKQISYDHMHVIAKSDQERIADVLGSGNRGASSHSDSCNAAIL